MVFKCNVLSFEFGVAGVRQEDKELAMELCGMSLLEVEDFLDDKRTHMTEGIIIGQVAVPRPDLALLVDVAVAHDWFLRRSRDGKANSSRTVPPCTNV